MKGKDNLLRIICQSKLLRSFYDDGLNENDADTKYDICRLLLELYTTIENGASYLWKEWSKYNYNRKLWWERDNYFKIVDEKIILRGPMAQYKSPVTQIIKYGSPKDIDIVFRLGSEKITDIIFHKNKYCFLKFIKLIYFSKEVCKIGGPFHIQSLIWNYCYLKQRLTENLPTIYYDLYDSTLIDKRWRIKLLVTLCAKDTHSPPGEYITDIEDICPWLSFQDYIYDKMIHINPEKLYAFENMDNYGMPAIKEESKDLGFYITKPIGSIYPSKHSNIIMLGQSVVINDIKIYIIQDIKDNESYCDRIYRISKYHPYWNGPYANIDQEQADFNKFIDIVNNKQIKYAWWPTYVCKLPKGHSFYQVLSVKPNTLYGNYGWYIYNGKGQYTITLDKTDITIDLIWNNNLWLDANGVQYNEYILNKFPEEKNEIIFKLPIFRETIGKIMNTNDMDMLNNYLLANRYLYTNQISNLVKEKYNVDLSLESNPEIWSCIWNDSISKWVPKERTLNVSGSVDKSLLLKIWKPIDLLKYKNTIVVRTNNACIISDKLHLEKNFYWSDHNFTHILTGQKFEITMEQSEFIFSYFIPNFADNFSSWIFLERCNKIIIIIEKQEADKINYLLKWLKKYYLTLDSINYIQNDIKLVFTN